MSKGSFTWREEGPSNTIILGDGTTLFVFTWRDENLIKEDPIRRFMLGPHVFCHAKGVNWP